MKKLALFIFVLFFAAIACKNSKEEGQQPEEKKDTLVTVDLKNLEAQGDSLVGKKIQVSGYVVHICQEDGKKIMLWDSVADVRVKVISDNPFDSTLVGQTVSVIGVLNSQPFTMKDYNDLEKKLKEEGHYKDDSLNLVYLYNKLQNSADSTITVYSVKFEKFVK